MDLNGLTLEQLAELKAQIQEKIEETSDGFFYVGKIQCYGMSSTERYQNIIAAKQSDEDSGYGENYLISIYTNNPNSGFNFVESEDKIPED